jgi:type II secretory pathway pseudopilin PulG
LIELLVVIAIIAILVSMLAPAIWRLVATSQDKATRNTLLKLQNVLHKEWQAVSEQVNNEPIGTDLTENLPPYRPIPLSQAASGFAKLLPSDAKTLRVVWVKLRLKQAFPQSLDEVFQFPYAIPPGVISQFPRGLRVPPLPAYVQALSNAGITAANYKTLPLTTQDGVSWQTSAANPEASAESAILLLMALQRNVSGQGVSAEVLSGRNIAAFATTGGLTAPGLVDAWGSPLQFCRWPTDYPDLASPTPAPTPLVAKPLLLLNGINDPGDKEGLLAGKAFFQNPVLVLSPTQKYTLWQLFEGLLPPPIGNPSPANDPPAPIHTAYYNPIFIHRLPTWNGAIRSYKLQPMIASRGPDKLLGLDPLTFALINAPDMATTNRNPANDNLTTLNVQ